MTDSNLDMQADLGNKLLKDRRAERRWRNIRFVGWLFILLLYAYFLFGPARIGAGSKSANKPYAALIRLNGEIMPGSRFSAKYVLPELNRAFKDKKAKGVVLQINSPGGSPVQASIIHDKILQLKHKYKKKVIVVAEDTLASGAYLVASAADKIYVSRDTLTGSIGVIMNGFGFADAMSKVGVSRRVYTAGLNKDRLDPFKKLDPQDVTKIKTVLNEVHQDFINDVVQGRGNRLKGDKKSLFSGDFWTGQTAVQLGLADGTANLWEALKKEYNVEHYRDYTTRVNFVQALLKESVSNIKLNTLSRDNPIQARAY